MGTWHSADTIARMIERIPDNCVLALDEAYIDFAEEPIAPPIDTGNANVIRYRTFSKAYGIAHKDIITGFNKIRNHFGINRVAQIGALASLQDENFLSGVRAAVSTARKKVEQFATAQGLTALPSSTNFVAVDLGSAEASKQMIAELNTRQVFMRMPGVEPLNRYIRVGLGTDREHDIFEDAFKEVINQTDFIKA